MRGTVFFEFLNEGASVLFDLRKTDFLDLGHTEDVASVFVFFAVCRDDVFGWQCLKGRSDRENLGSQIGGRDEADRGQFIQYQLIDFRRCGQCEVEGVGNDSTHKQACHAFRNGDAGLSETIGNDGAGRTHWPIHEKDRLLGRRDSDAVMIQNLNDRNIPGPSNGLGELVVIDKNESMNPLHNGAVAVFPKSPTSFLTPLTSRCESIPPCATAPS